jgi:hypothetical protein
MRVLMCLACLFLCGCNPYIQPGVYSDGKRKLEVASDSTIQVEGKCVHYDTYPDSLKVTIDGIESRYYLEVPNSMKFVLTLRGGEKAERDLSGVYTRLDPKNPVPEKPQLQQLREKRATYRAKLDELNVLLSSTYHRISGKIEYLKSVGVKSGADIKNAETKQVAEALVALTKNKEGLEKAKNIISAKVNELTRSIELLETNAEAFTSDESLEELVNSANQHPKSPVESIEFNDALDKALK